MEIALFLFYGGIAGIIVSALLGVISFLVARRNKRRLWQKLKDEYGEEKHL